MKFNVSEINKLSLVDFLKLFNSLTEQELIDIIDSNALFNVNENIFKALFLRSNIEVKKHILKNEILFDKVMNIKSNANGKILFELVDTQTLRLIISSQYIIKYEQQIINYLKKINYETFSKIINEIDFLQAFNINSIYKNNKYLYDFLVNTLKYDINISELFINRIKNGLNPLTLLRTSNEKELFILAKFNLIVNIKDE